MVIPVSERRAREYKTEGGKAPFRDWLVNLKDVRGKAKIIKAVAQMEAGNFGDHKPIERGNGLQERRISYGPGYRIYYIIEGDELIILFVGSDKSDQKSAIGSAKAYLADYNDRRPKPDIQRKVKVKNPRKCLGEK